jgi:hypothetical protein
MNLEMGNGHDRAMVRHAITEAVAGRWDFPLEKRKKWLEALYEALEIARKNKSDRGINSCLRTVAAFERLNLDYKVHGRLEDGLPTDITHLIFTFDSPPGDDSSADALPEAEGGRLCS